MALSQARLRELLRYDSRTGRFTWLVSTSNRAPKGRRAGSLTHGYRTICVDGTKYSAARLAVFWMTGKWPPNSTDHRNRVTDDNRWSNLRLATQSQNCANSIAKKNRRYKGVHWDKDRQCYGATIMVNRHSIALGRFPTARAAHRAYLTAARKHFGEFARAR